MKTFTITHQDFEFGVRLVPSFYYYTKVIKEKNLDKGTKYIKFEQIAEKISDGEHTHIPRLKNKGVRYLYGRNIKQGLINFDPISDDSFISEKNYEQHPRCHVVQNDILISIYGTVGKSAIYKKEYVGKAGLPRHVARITLKANSPITGEFITAYFRSKAGQGQLLNMTTGNIQQLLSLKNIRKLDLPIPEDSFVKQITMMESQAIEYEIEALQKIKEAKSIFYDKLGVNFSSVSDSPSFSVNLSDIRASDIWTPSFSRPLYKNTLKAIQKKSKTKALGEIVTMQRGDEVGREAYKQFLEKKDTDIPFIRTSDIVNFEVDQFADYFIERDIYNELRQDLMSSDVLFTKDGKIGVTGMVTEHDEIILSSGIERLRLKETEKDRLTQEYIFLLLSIKEIGLYAARRRAVIASTIPHLREERLAEVELPLVDQITIANITNLVREAFALKDKRKVLIKQISEEMDKYFVAE